MCVCVCARECVCFILYTVPYLVTISQVFLKDKVTIFVIMVSLDEKNYYNNFQICTGNEKKNSIRFGVLLGLTANCSES